MHLKTPLIALQSSRAAGKRVRVKMECWQEPGSFKIRGIGHLMRKAYERGEHRFVASSGGNAGLAAAFAARTLGASLDVVVPESTPHPVRRRLEDLHARVTVTGRVWDEADRKARAIAAEGACYVPPFDHPDLWEGHASLVHECAEQGPPPQAVVVSVGGGGLMCGVLQGMQQIGWQNVPLVAVETEQAASLAAAVAADGPVALDRIGSVAKSLGALTVAQEAFDWTRRHPVTLRQVSDAQAVTSCLRFLYDHRSLVEPACGAALAVAYDELTDVDDLLVVACGGATASDQDLWSWARDLGVSEDDVYPQGGGEETGA